MKQTFQTREDGSIEIDFDKQEAYFIRDDLIAKMTKDDLGYWNFAHPMWLCQFRIFTGCKPMQLDRLEWRTA